MNELNVISKSIEELQKLTLKETIYLDDVQLKFMPDLQKFIVGETLSMRDGKLVIGNNLYKKWLMKIRIKGFDYEIDFKR